MEKTDVLKKDVGRFDMGRWLMLNKMMQKYKTMFPFSVWALKGSWHKVFF